ncbi:MAG: ABC transporter ATP-binding protein [Planctomycetota bacterium]|nr:ABC transporter ATP-binding protein [Planctomycetota bacterium]
MMRQVDLSEYLREIRMNAMPSSAVPVFELGMGIPRPAGVAVLIRDLTRIFDGKITAIESLSLEIAPGEFVAILGPSGCGKSTLLRIIAGLDNPTNGSVQTAEVADTGNAAEHHRKIAYVFQDAHLLPWRNVLRNVSLPLELMGVGRGERELAAKAALEQVGLAEAIGRYPAQLSGGMKMRVSLARALVTQPKLLLLDEPFAALDEITRQKLDEQLRQLWARHGMTVMFVTHSTAEATFLADRAIVLTARPARIVKDIVIDLPSERVGSTRATPQFAAITRGIYEALELGGA